MLVYWFVLFLMIVFLKIPKNLICNSKKLFYAFIILCIYGSIRLDYGLDYDAYQTLFNDLSLYGINFSDRIEIGYKLLNILCPSFRFLIVITSIFTCFTLYLFTRKFIPERYYLLFIILLFLAGDKTIFFQFSGLRNAIAINLITLSVIFISDKRYLFSIILCLIACFFHTSSLIFIPLIYIFGNGKNITTKQSIFVFVFISLLLVIGSSSILDSISGFIEVYFSKYSSYLESDRMNHEKSIIMYIYIIINLVLVLYVLTKYKLNRNDLIILKLSLVYLIALTLGSITLRMTHYYIIYYISSFVIVYNNKIIRQPIRIAFLSSLLIFLIYSFFVIYLNNPYFAFDNYYSILD